jgi:hypothetical protein
VTAPCPLRAAKDRGRALRGLALAAVAGLAGCAFLPRAPTPTPLEGEWARQRDGATRRAFVYDGLRHRATCTATHLSLAVREARARRLGEWLGWTPVELEQRLAQERKEAAEGEEFEVALYTAEPRFNNLDAPRTDWRVALKVDGADLLARKITAVDRDAATLGLFPFIGPFDVVYRVVVPLAQGGPVDGREYTLQLASALGKLDLDFGAREGAITPQQPVPPP